MTNLTNALTRFESLTVRFQTQQSEMEKSCFKAKLYHKTELSFDEC